MRAIKLSESQLGWAFGEYFAYQRIASYRARVTAAKRAATVASWRAGRPGPFHMALAASFRFGALAEAVLRRAGLELRDGE